MEIDVNFQLNGYPSDDPRLEVNNLILKPNAALSIVCKADSDIRVSRTTLAKQAEGSTSELTRICEIPTHR